MKKLKILLFFFLSSSFIGFSQIPLGEIVVYPDREIYCKWDTIHLYVSGGSHLDNTSWITDLRIINSTDSTLSGEIIRAGDFKVSYFGYLPDSTSLFRFKWLNSIETKFPESYDVCDRFPININGNLISDFGTYEFTYASSNPENCDSIAVYYIGQFTKDEFQENHIILCPGDSVEVYDVTIDRDTFQTIPIDTFNHNCYNFMTVHSTIADTSAPTMQCYRDTFINALAFKWSKRHGAEKYDLYLNDSFLKTQTSSGYLHQITNEDEILNLRIKPKSSLGCNFRGVSLTCSTSDASPVSEIELSNSISIFPNPNSGIFKLETISKMIHLDIFDTSGRKILSQEEQNVDLTAFESGIYFLKILTKNGYVSQRVIKK